jgi:hypothetical protein
VLEPGRGRRRAGGLVTWCPLAAVPTWQPGLLVEPARRRPRPAFGGQRRQVRRGGGGSRASDGTSRGLGVTADSLRAPGVRMGRRGEAGL